MEIEYILQIYSNTDIIEKPVIGKEATKENFVASVSIPHTSEKAQKVFCRKLDTAAPSATLTMI